jgi:hypothetical protein
MSSAPVDPHMGSFAMRLYVKLALIVVVACATQVALSSQWTAETCFGLRCLAASTLGDSAAEARLVRECETTLRAAQDAPVTVVALNAAPTPW